MHAVDITVQFIKIQETSVSYLFVADSHKF